MRVELDRVEQAKAVLEEEFPDLPRVELPETGERVARGPVFARSLLTYLTGRVWEKTRTSPQSPHAMEHGRRRLAAPEERDGNPRPAVARCIPA
jgi:hypothetical protein